MATAPVKSPLHNFPPPFLKWGSKNSVNNQHRFRRPVDSPPPPIEDANDQHNDTNTSRSDSHNHRGRVTCRLLENARDTNSSRLHLGSRSSRNRSSSADQSQSSPEKEPSLDARGDDCEGKVDFAAAKDSGGGGAEPAQKLWNLRPRRAAAAAAGKSSADISGAAAGGKSSVDNGGAAAAGKISVEIGGAAAENQLKSTRLRGSGEKRKLWVALSKDEIEEDVYALTGSKPARRPRKRPKNVQKQLDSLFPGLWLVGVSPEAYRSFDVPSKG